MIKQIFFGVCLLFRILWQIPHGKNWKVIAAVAANGNWTVIPVV
jgi:hypothetical protein